MTYYETPGALSDVANFLVYYFNEEYIINLFEFKFNENKNNYLEYYFQLKYYCNNIICELHPFAYTDDNTYSVLTKALYEQPMEYVTLSSFMDFIESNQFKLKVYNHWFRPDLHLTDLKDFDIFKNITQLSISEKMKYRLLSFFNNFDYYRKELVRVFIRLYDFALEIRNNHKSVIKSCKETYDCQGTYKKFYSRYNVDISEYRYSLTFINSISYFISDESKIIYFGVKYSVYEATKKITMETFAMAYGNETRAKIVELIGINQPVSINDLKDKLDIKHSTLYYHLSLLCSEGILLSSKNIDKKYYYRINIEYYEKVGLSLKHKRSNSKKMKRSIDFNYITIDSDKLLTFNPESGDTYFLDETASIVLTLLEQFPNVEDLIIAMSKEYDEDPAIIKADVHQTIAELVEKRVLVEVS